MYKKKISPCFVHFRETVLFNHMRMMSHPRAEGDLPIPNAERRHHHNFGCPKWCKKSRTEGRERKKEKDATEWRLFHVTRGLLHQHHPRHRWVTEEAQSEAAAASPAEQTLLTAA